MKMFLVLVLLSSFAVNARTGNDQGNGGDIYAAEFVDIAWKVVNFLRNSQIAEVNLDKFEQTVRRTKVESTTRLLSLNHLPKDAINYPRQSRIVFNRQRWKAMDNGERPVLVLHEYLGLLGLEGASYDLSRHLLGAFRYGQWHQVNCVFPGGNLNVGIDESAGMDTILLTANFDDGHWFLGNTLRPVGEFSQMIQNGSFVMAFDGEKPASYLVAFKSDTDGRLTGQFAADGTVYAIACTVVNQKPIN